MHLVKDFNFFKDSIFIQIKSIFQVLLVYIFVTSNLKSLKIISYWIHDYSTWYPGTKELGALGEILIHMSFFFF